MALAAVALTLPVYGKRTVAQKKVQARTQFETAERMREALNGRPQRERTVTQYKRVIDAYRAVYYTAPTSNKADEAIVAVGELLAEMGRQFDDQKALKSAIGQYEFLRQEYPGSRYRVDALFTIGQIYKDDLDDAAQAKAAFQEFVKRYPRSEQVADARAALRELEQPPAPKKPESKEAKKKPAESAGARDEKKAIASKPAPPAVTAAEDAADDEEDQETQRPSSSRVMVTGIRHWSTPDYTRVAIDLGDEVKYDAGRVPRPDRIFFDLHNTRLASTLVGKTFEVGDGFLRKIRIAQYQAGETRLVLEVDDAAAYSSFLLPNPYRLIVDVHGQKPPQKLAKKVVSKPKETAKPAITAERMPEPEPSKPAVETAKTEPDQPAKPAPAAKAETTAATKVKGPEAVPASSSKEMAKTSSGTETVPVKSINDEPTATGIKHGRSGKKTAKKEPEPLPGHEAQPTANGDRSLIRALGLKIGRIVVDAGHGGHDTGTIGPNGLEEKDLVLEVALRLGKLLEKRMGAEVVYTRDDDTFIPLETRTAVANQNQADLFISVHANSSHDPGARGVETYYLNFTSSPDALEVAARENAVSEKSIHELQDLVKKIALKEKIEESREFAGDVQQALYSSVSGRGVRNRGVKKAPFIVLIGANMPSILAEIAFVSNPTDAKRLKASDYRQKIAEALYRGIAKYVGGLSGVKVASKVVVPEQQDTSR